MTETRCWLVEREVSDRDVVHLVYATPDGERAHRLQRSTALLRANPVTAAVEVRADDLEPVEDPADVDRYAGEAARMADRHDPDETV